MRGSKEERKQAMLSLLAERSATANWLGNKLDVSCRSIYRYVDELRQDGVRIVSDRGQGGGILLRPSKERGGET